MMTPVLYQVELLIRGRKAMTAVEERSRRQNRESRQATVEVRAATVTLRPPWRFDRELPAISVGTAAETEALMKRL